MNDLKFAIRQLWKNPGFTVVAALTLAFGIGANTAIFSVINGVWLTPLPYPNPDRLVTLWERDPQRGIDQDRVSGPNYLDWCRQNTTFESLAATPGWPGSGEFNLMLRDGTTRISATYASSSFFPTLGTAPILGRTFLPEEDRKEGNRVAVLSHGLWQRLFAGDSNILGRSITLDTYGRRDYTIVGVMPPGFGAPSQCELWLPMGWMGVILEERRSAHWHHVIGRLKPGVTLAQARAEMNSIQAGIRQNYPEAMAGSEVAVIPMLEQALGSNLRTALRVLWGVVTAVLLMACANVANLSLARAVTRRKEIAVRLALGASRRRVIRQLLVESLGIALLGCVLGVVLGYGALRLIIVASPPDIPRLDQVTLDGEVLAFTFGISLVTGLLFGLAPAWQGTRLPLHDTLKASGRGASAARAMARSRNILVMGEVALSLVLLVAAGLMLQSFLRMLQAERGFRPDHLLTAELDFSVSGFTTWARPTEKRPQVPLQEVMERLRARPGIVAVGAGSTLVSTADRPASQPFILWGRPDPAPGQPRVANFKGISPGWIQAMGARIVRGRDFDESDTLQSSGVAIINESLARRYFPNEDPIGKHLSMDASQSSLTARDTFGIPYWSEIVGVVADIQSLDARPQTVPEVYRPSWQWPMQSPTVLVRFTGDPVSVVNAVRREVRDVLPSLPAPRLIMMTERLSDGVAAPRLHAGLLSVFGAVALLLAAIGLYGVLAYTVSQREHEIGIRMALGAGKRQVLTLIMKRGMGVVLVGIAVGIPASLALGRAMSGLLYQIQPADLETIVLVTLLLGFVAFLACWVPARRASRVHPMTALRAE